MKDIIITQYKSEEVTRISPYSLGRFIKEPGQMAEVLAEFLNVGMKDYREGVAVGELAQKEHRTIQGSIIRFCLGVIIGLSKQEYTDARNEMPVAMAKKIAKLVEDGELKMGWLI